MSNRLSPSIRAPRPEDAAAFVDLHRQRDRETDLLLYSGDDRPIDAEMMAAVLSRTAETGDLLILRAWDGGAPVAYISGMRGRAPKTRHSIVFGVAAPRAWWGRRLARRPIEAFEREARDLGVRRIELTDIVENRRVRRFCQSLGYKTGSRKTGRVTLDGELVDKFAMAKLLPA